MNNREMAEFLKEEIQKILQSREGANPDNRILICHVSADMFLRMAYLFVGIHGSK